MPATIKETTSSAKQPGAAKHRPMAPAQMAADTEEALDLLREAARRVAKTTDLSQRIADAWGLFTTGQPLLGLPGVSNSLRKVGRLCYTPGGLSQ